jgi:phosphate transport system protein
VVLRWNCDEEQNVETHQTQLDREIGQLKAALIHMAAVGERMIDQATKELVARDASATDGIQADEDEMNRSQIEIDDRVVTILATRQPVAIDLRFLLAAVKINNELERVGDLAMNIDRKTRKILREPPLKPLIDIPRMSELARKMLRQSLEAFLGQDVELAQTVILADDELDALKEQVLRELLTYMVSDPATIERALLLFLVARHLERLGDHATNIAQDVIYMVQGRDVRHPRTPR